MDITTIFTFIYYNNKDILMLNCNFIFLLFQKVKIYAGVTKDRRGNVTPNASKLTNKK